MECATPTTMIIGSRHHTRQSHWLQSGIDERVSSSCTVLDMQNCRERTDDRHHRLRRPLGRVQPGLHRGKLDNATATADAWIQTAGISHRCGPLRAAFRFGVARTDFANFPPVSRRLSKTRERFVFGSCNEPVTSEMLNIPGIPGFIVRLGTAVGK